MLPAVQGLFMLVNELAARRPVTETTASQWLVERHGLGPLAARAGASQFRSSLAASVVAWKRVERELPPLVDQFVKAGVRVAPLKGTAYGMWLYDTPAERPMNDVDLLVDHSDEAKAVKILENSGFTAGTSEVVHHATVWERGELVIDLHRSMIGPGRSRIDLAAIWSRAVAGWPAGAQRLEANDAYAFHLIHMTRNRLRVPAIQLVDAARLLALLDSADVALARCRAWGLGDAAALAHRFVCALLDHPSDRPVGWVGPTLDELAVFEPPRTWQKVGFDVATAGSWTQLAARAVGVGVNRFARLFRGS